MADLINRQAAIDTIVKLTTCNGVRELFEYVQKHHLSDMWSGGIVDAIDAVIGVPSAQPERLTDDDFETIRIHLNAQKEKLCNQRRWEEAEEYQRIIDQFMAFAVQPEIIRCKDCKHCEHWCVDKGRCFLWHEGGIDVFENGFCNYAERRTDECMAI